MPIRQRGTALLAFGFHADNCVKFSGSSNQHSKMVVRIRKDDLATIERDGEYGASQIYVRVPDQESLSVDIGSFIKVDINKRELCFEVSSIHVMTAITSQTRFYRTAVLSGSFTKKLAEV